MEILNRDFIAVHTKNIVYLFSKNGKLLWNKRFNNPINSMAISPNRVVVGLKNGIIHVLKLDGTSLKAAKTARRIDNVKITSDSRYVISASKDFGMGKVSSLNSKLDVLWKRKVSWSFIDSLLLSISRYAGCIVVGSSDVTILNRNGEILRRFEIFPVFLSVSIDGSLTACSDFKTIYLLTKNGVLWKYKAKNNVNGMLQSPSGNYIIRVDGDNLKILDKTGKLLENLEIDESVNALSISSDESKIVIGTDSAIQLFELQRKK